MKQRKVSWFTPLFLVFAMGSFLLVSCNDDSEPSASAPEPAKVEEAKTDDSAKPAESEEKSSPAPEEKAKEEKAGGAKAGDESAATDVNSEKTPMKAGKELDQKANPNLEVATLGGGCFWCTEAVLERVEGVADVVSGYMGGLVENPTYEQICTKTTGHAEVIQVTYDKTVLTFEDVLDIFWQAHDPTTLNQQGADRGPQYRSVIFFHSPEQKNLAEKSKAALDASGMYEDPAVTEITEASTFWEAEEYHQDYYVNNKDKNPYCRIVITPKMKKLGFE